MSILKPDIDSPHCEFKINNIYRLENNLGQAQVSQNKCFLKISVNKSEK